MAVLLVLELIPFVLFRFGGGSLFGNTNTEAWQWLSGPMHSTDGSVRVYLVMSRWVRCVVGDLTRRVTVEWCRGREGTEQY